MNRHLARLAEAFVVRAVPGLINMAVLLLLASRLSTSQYGLFSTLVATAGLLSNLFFGVVAFPVVAQQAKYAARGERDLYISTAVALMGAMAVVLLALYGVARLVVPIEPIIVPMVLAMSAQIFLQELTRAEMKVQSYGASDMVQATTMYCLCFLLVSKSAGYALVGGLFAISYLVATSVNIFALRSHRFVRPKAAVVRDILKVGPWLAASNLSENILFTGGRYLILAFGNTHQLGLFSMAADLSQRTIGFAMNTISFIVVPQAFREHAAQGVAAFRTTLLRGSALAVFLGVGAAAVVAAALSPLSPWPSLAEKWSYIAFLIVAAAIVVNRLKKLLLDSMALALGRSRWIAGSNALGGLTGLLAIYLLMRAAVPYGPFLGYTAGYLAIFALGIIPAAPMFRSHGSVTGRSEDV